jgi:hypothetical protein
MMISSLFLLIDHEAIRDLDLGAHLEEPGSDQ